MPVTAQRRSPKRAVLAVVLASAVAACAGSSSSGRHGDPTAPSSSGSAAPALPHESPSTVTTQAGGASQPPIVSRPIPYSDGRRAEMAAYAKIHYGTETSALVAPKVVVEHYTGSSTFTSAYETFAADEPDVEFHELPGVCSHFVIDTDGTIYQLVPLDLMCRHTVGLNATALGVEHVGTTDSEILNNPRQMAASLSLSVWLMQQFQVPLVDVIGHAESLTSPYHRELVAAWRCQTHDDWTHADMEDYRAQLTSVAQRDGVPLGPKKDPVPSDC